MSFSQRLALTFGMAGIAAGSWGGSVSAQSSLPVCPPPASQEYLVLTRGESEADRSRIAAVLPEESSVLICTYIDEVVVRAGRFNSLETANAWASYMNTVEGFESFVTRPAVGSGSQQVVATPGDSTFQPRRLASGYAVLVEYGTQPEIASQVGAVVPSVGLAVYQERAYLIAGYSQDSATAANTLQQLGTARISALLVDAQQVVQLVDEVSR